MQLLVLCGFVLCIVLSVFLLNDTFSRQPYDLFGISGSAELR
jgi:hypothetical protein